MTGHCLPQPDRGLWRKLATYLAFRLDGRRRTELSAFDKARVLRLRPTDPVQQRVLVLVDSIGLAEVEALRYAKELHCDRLTAAHFVIDESHAARLQVRWQRLGHGVELRMIDCADRNLGRAAHSVVAQATQDYPRSTVTVLLPRRMYSPLVGRLLHDRTADTLARMVTRVPGASAQILVCDVKSRVARALRAADREHPGQCAEIGITPRPRHPRRHDSAADHDALTW